MKLDINRLIRDGFIRRDAFARSFIRWSPSYWGEIATGSVTSDLTGNFHGWFEIEIGGRAQRLSLVACPRPFGGRQWYFICPQLGRRASVLWRPPGAYRFPVGRVGGRHVLAFASQFHDASGRAHLGQSRIKSRLIGNNDPDEWELPPKPKWMRWATYNRLGSGTTTMRRF